MPEHTQCLILFIGGFLTYRKPHMVVLCGYTSSPWLYQSFFSLCVNFLPGKTQRWLCVPYRGYTSHRGYACLYVVIYCKCTEKESEPRNDTQGRPPFIMTAATSRKYYIRWFYVVIHPTRGYTFESVLIPMVLLQMCQHLTRKTQRWLCVPYCGYMFHVVVMRGYTWLYTANVPKRSQNHEMTPKVVRPSS